MPKILHEFSAPVRAKLFDTQPLHSKYNVIRAVLARSGRIDLSSYFAVPNVDTEGRQISWSTPYMSSKTPVPLSELAAPDRKDLLDKVQRLHDELFLLKESYGNTPDARTLKALLTSLLDVPDERHIYSVDGKPIFVYWSHEQEQPIPSVEYPRIERIQLGSRGNISHTVDSASRTAAPEKKTVERQMLAPNGWIVFVGAVSFFGTALASMALAALALYYLVHNELWPFYPPTFIISTSDAP